MKADETKAEIIGWYLLLYQGIGSYTLARVRATSTPRLCEINILQERRFFIFAVKRLHFLFLSNRFSGAVRILGRLA